LLEKKRRRRHRGAERGEAIGRAGGLSTAQPGEEALTFARRDGCGRGRDSSLPFGGKTRTIAGLLETVSPSEDSSNYDDPAEGALNPREKPMGFFDHLEELRWTLVKCAVVYVIFAAVIGFYLKEFNHLLMWPLDQVRSDRPGFEVPLESIGVSEIFGMIFQVCMMGALAPAAPFIIFFVAKFVAPALSPKELRMIVPGGLLALILFTMGAALGFFVLVPQTINMSIELNELMGFGINWTPASYYSIMMWLVLGVGLGFEFPLLILLLVYLGMLSTAFLKKYRRHAVVLIVVIAAIVTPTTDPVTMGLFAAPLYILFELAILAGSALEKARARAALVN
jgi:sec-independent protein translocase protein TatC